MKRSIVFVEIMDELCTVWSRTPPDTLAPVVMYPGHEAGKALALNYARQLRTTLQETDLVQFITNARLINSRMNDEPA